MHLYPCSCGQQFPVSPAHAGQSVQCPKCGASIVLPKLGELKSLPLAEDLPSEPKETRWGHGRGVAFSALIAAFTILFAYGARCTYGWLSITKPPTVEQVIADGVADIDTRNIGGLFDFWLFYADPGLTTRKTLNFEYFRRLRNSWRQHAYVCYAGMAVTLVGIWLVLPRNENERGLAGD